MRPWRLKILALCPEHPKRDQNPKFTPLSETTSIPVCFIWESLPRGFNRVVNESNNAWNDHGNIFTLSIRYQRLTGLIETYLGWAASWNSGRWKSPSKPSNALSTVERRHKLAAKHHGIYKIPHFVYSHVVFRNLSAKIPACDTNIGLKFQTQPKE